MSEKIFKISGCAKLWAHQFINTTSKVGPCCNSEHTWKHVSIDEGILSDNHKNMRDKMRIGVWPEECHSCKQIEELHGTSIRTGANQHAHELGMSGNYWETEPDNVLDADIKFDNVCNFACRHCTTESSSKLVSEAELNSDLKKYSNYNLSSTNNFNADQKYKHVQKLIRNGLKRFKTTGGEPLAQRHFINLVNWCIEEDYAKDLELSFTTNLSKFPKVFQDKILQFKKLDIRVSIDGTGNVYNYIRHLGNWDVLCNNLQELSNLKETNKHIFVELDPTPMTYNILDYHNVHMLAFDLGFSAGNNLILKPDNNLLHIKFLPKHIIEEAASIQITPDARDYFDYISKNNYEHPTMQKKFKEYTLKLDSIRNQSYRDYLQPVLVDYIDSI